jgi:hypothetical protein
MRSIGLITMAGLFCAAVAVSAQTSTKSRTAQPAAKPVTHITIVGCVEPSDQSTGTAGASTGTTETKYMLTNAHTTSSNAKNNTGSNKSSNSASRSSSNSPSASSNKTYQLSGNEAAVGAEVGHIVEIVAVEEPPAGGARTAKPPVEPVVVVDEVKMVSPNCQ